MILPCCHLLCVDCAQEWKTTPNPVKFRCPVCREELTEYVRIDAVRRHVSEIVKEKTEKRLGSHYTMQEIVDYLIVCRDSGWIEDDGLSSEEFADWIQEEHKDGRRMPLNGDGNRNALGRAVKTVSGLALVRKKDSQRRYIVQECSAMKS